MADIKRCDRCGKVYERHAKKIKYKNVVYTMLENTNDLKFNGFVLSNYRGCYDCTLPYDLCPECLDSLLEWFNNGNK